MVAIDSSHDAPVMRAETPHTGQIVFFSILIAALVAAVALTLGSSDGDRWPFAAEMVFRFSVLLFIAAMIAEPLGRLIPTPFMRAVGRERPSLILGFAAASAISLICTVAPSRLGGEALTAPTVAYCLLTAMVLTVMLFSAHPATMRWLGAPAWRAMQRIATAYFWLAFTLAGIGHLVGPHRPDDWHGISLMLLVGALLIRFADTFVAHWRSAGTQKAG